MHHVRTEPMSTCCVPLFSDTLPNWAPMQWSWESLCPMDNTEMKHGGPHAVAPPDTTSSWWSGRIFYNMWRRRFFDPGLIFLELLYFKVQIPKTFSVITVTQTSNAYWSSIKIPLKTTDCVLCEPLIRHSGNFPGHSLLIGRIHGKYFRIFVKVEKIGKSVRKREPKRITLR